MVYELHLQGVTPLLMSSAEAEREGDTYIAYRALGKKRGKTLEDEARLRELEWYTRLYFDDEIGCFIPGKNIKELLRSAATKWRRGEDVKRSLIVPSYRIPLIYEGPTTPSELWSDGRFSYTTMVANAGAGSGRVERTRPKFDQWQLRTEIAFDPEDIDASDLEMWVARAQKYGLGDYRPDFGAFEASATFVREQREDARATAVKPRDEIIMAVNGTRAKRMLAKT